MRRTNRIAPLPRRCGRPRPRFRLRDQRHPGILQRLQLCAGRRVFAPDFAGENGISRAERRPSQYEHAARLGRRHVRVGRFLRNVRPVRHHGVAGFRLRLQHVSRIGADLRRHPGRSRRQRTPAAQPPVARPLVRQQRNRRSMETPRQTQQPVPQILYGRRGRTVRPRKRNHLPEYPARRGGQPLRRHRTLLALVALAGLGGSIRQTAGATATYTTGTSGTKATPYRPTTPKSPVSSRNTDSNPTPNSPRSSVSSPKGSAASPLRP